MEILEIVFNVYGYGWLVSFILLLGWFAGIRAVTPWRGYLAACFMMACVWPVTWWVTATFALEEFKKRG